MRVRHVDFAHAFRHSAHSGSGGGGGGPRPPRDENFLAGLRALIARLHGVMAIKAHDTLL